MFSLVADACGTRLHTRLTQRQLLLGVIYKTRTYYSRIILNSFCYLLFSKLCLHNPSRPSQLYLPLSILREARRGWSHWVHTVVACWTQVTQPWPARAADKGQEINFVWLKIVPGKGGACKFEGRIRVFKGYLCMVTPVPGYFFNCWVLHNKMALLAFSLSYKCYICFSLLHMWL